MAIIAVVVGLSVVAYVLTESDHITVSEAVSQADSLVGKNARIGGKVDPLSINWDSNAQVMKFALTDDDNRLDVVFQGVVPDDFKPGADLIVEGRYTTGGEFEALSFPGRTLCSICH
jgi:cytochrome c-type biogenesis protein CcmE